MAEALVALAISTLPVDREAAADAARQALAHATEGGFRVMEGQATAVLAAVNHDAGDFSTAAALAARALALRLVARNLAAAPGVTTVTENKYQRATRLLR